MFPIDGTINWITNIQILSNLFDHEIILNGVFYLFHCSDLGGKTFIRVLSHNLPIGVMEIGFWDTFFNGVF